MSTIAPSVKQDNHINIPKDHFYFLMDVSIPFKWYVGFEATLI